jgi:pyochelin synthetase
VDASDLITELGAAGIQLWEERGDLRYRAPSGRMNGERLAVLREHKAALLAELRRAAAVAPRPEAWFDPFPLTDVQAAYLVGRGTAYPYGGVGCHGYGELRFEDLDPARLEEAWQALLRRHDMLRAVIRADGSQQVMAEVPPYRIAFADLRGTSRERVERAIEATRAEMDHRVYAPDEWPLFDLRVTRGDEGALLHLSIDFLIADFVSIQLLVEELWLRYRDPAALPVAPEITFRDVQLAERARRAGARFERDRAYWWERIDDLPGPPELPVLTAVEAPPRFQRRELTLAAGEWQALGARATAAGVTPSCAVLAAYAEVVGRWSRQPRFTLDLTVLTRPQVHGQVGRLVGDFTSVELLEVDQDPARSFRERAGTLQARLWEDLDHGLVSGIEVMREMRRRRTGPVLFPVVFTSSVGLHRAPETGRPALSRLVHGISQTPQVWLDCQVTERDGALALNWDVRDGVFPDDLVDVMFGALHELLRRLAAGGGPWDSACPVPVPAGQLRARAAANDARAPVPVGLLHEGVFAQALRTPDRLAVVDGRRSLTYGELAAAAAAVAGALDAAGRRPGELVAIAMAKGWEQVAAVLGTLAAGCAYTPIDAGQPPARRARMLADSGARSVLAQSWVDGPDPGGPAQIAVDRLTPSAAPASLPPRRVEPDDLAYVIYTSGSTGVPKGVMISHRGALNTIQDVNRRFGVGPDDRVLGLASLGFDLSVYDIFGVLGAGGCLVLPDAGRRSDPSHWAELVAAHGVTLWNSVPAQIEMLRDFLQSEPGVRLPSLRLALLSGDWIPVTLPDQVRGRLPGLELVSLGGATEAAIWSIFHRIEAVEPGWRSIPYGRPLANQAFHVLDAALRPVPDLVAGELYIAGTGLALGYLGDEAKTAERFVPHPATGARLYRTGDLGRYLPNGEIEFMGREDSQVKIRGHRIELAEVEAALLSHPAVAAAAALVDGDPPARRLAAFVEPGQRAAAEPAAGEPAAAELAGVAVAAAAELRASVDGEEMAVFASQLDDTALLQMVWALRRRGLFTRGTAGHTVEEVLAGAGVAPRHQRLVRRWLRALRDNGMLRRDDASGRYHGAPEVDAAAVEAAWHRVAELQPAAERRTELLEYFREAADHLPELLSGELDPLALLFPSGRTEIHEVAYNAMFLTRYLNRLLTAAACHVASRWDEPEPLRVLEVGAGVGGTSFELIPALASFDVEYHFTDVSRFFLNNARERFGEFAWVTYGRYDMNRDYREQGLLPNSHGIVVCANVLHYARDAGRVLAALRELLLPGGWLLFIEATRDSYQVMTSMELLFDEASGEFEDVRRADEQTFVTRAQWLELLRAAGADSVACLPERDVVTDRMGMQVFAARFKSDRRRIAPGDLRAHLAERLPEPMLPAHVQVVDRLPLTGNGKVDRGTLRAWLPAMAPAARAARGEEPRDDVERRVALIWARLLGMERVGRDESFFELGGDSLLAAQLAGQLREQLPEASELFFDGLLRLMMESPTVAALADQIRSGRPAGPEAPAPAGESPLVVIGDVQRGPARVLVHDATGALSAYGELIELLRGEVPLAGLVVRHADAYLDVAPELLVEQIASDYVRALLAAGHVRVLLVGWRAGGLLAAELARQLAESGVRVERLVLVGTEPVPPPVEDDSRLDELLRRELGLPDVAGCEDLGAARDVLRHSLLAAAAHEPLPYAGDITLVQPAGSGPQAVAWRELCIGEVTVVEVPGGEPNALRGPGAREVAALLAAEAAPAAP